MLNNKKSKKESLIKNYKNQLNPNNRKVNPSEIAFKKDFCLNSISNNLHRYSSYKDTLLTLNPHQNIRSNHKSKEKKSRIQNLSKNHTNFSTSKPSIKTIVNICFSDKDKNTPITAFTPKLNLLKYLPSNNNNTMPQKNKQDNHPNFNIISNNNHNNNLNNNIINNNKNMDYVHTSITRKSMEDELISMEEKIFQLKLQNSRFENELRILTEKNKSLNDVIDIKDKDMNMYKNKFNKLYNDSTEEINSLSEKYKILSKKTNTQYSRAILTIKSLINIVVDLSETIIITGNVNNSNNTYKGGVALTKRKSSSANLSITDLSFDIYESNTISGQENTNKDSNDDKKLYMLKQIKDIIIEKLNNIIKEFNLILDNTIVDKIEHIRNWNLQSAKYSLRNSFNNKKNVNNNNTNNNINDDILGSLSKFQTSLYDVSNDFDLSVSKSFYYNCKGRSVSPRFNNSVINTNNKLTISNNNIKCCSNKFNDRTNSIGFFDNKSNNLKSDNNRNNEDKKNNILGHSIGDFISCDSNSLFKSVNKNIQLCEKCNSEKNDDKDESKRTKSDQRSRSNSLSFTNNLFLDDNHENEKIENKEEDTKNNNVRNRNEKILENKDSILDIGNFTLKDDEN